MIRLRSLASAYCLHQPALSELSQPEFTRLNILSIIRLYLERFVDKKIKSKGQPEVFQWENSDKLTFAIVSIPFSSMVTIYLN